MNLFEEKIPRAFTHLVQESFHIDQIHWNAHWEYAKNVRMILLLFAIRRDQAFKPIGTGQVFVKTNLVVQWPENKRWILWSNNRYFEHQTCVEQVHLNDFEQSLKLFLKNFVRLFWHSSFFNNLYQYLLNAGGKMEALFTSLGVTASSFAWWLGLREVRGFESHAVL